MSPHVFTGEDLVAWIAAVNQFFEENDFPEENKAQLAMGFLGQDVLDCIESLRVLLGEISGVDWVWTWPRLITALHRMSAQIAHYRAESDRIKMEKIVKSVAIIGTSVAACVAAPFALLGILGLAGFTAGGVAAGSAAAITQGAIGAVEAGTVFAFCQSAAAGGVALMTVVDASALAATALSVGGTALNAAAWKRVTDGNPSHSWADGNKFRPSPDLIATLLHLA